MEQTDTKASSGWSRMRLRENTPAMGQIATFTVKDQNRPVRFSNYKRVGPHKLLLLIGQIDSDSFRTNARETDDGHPNPIVFTYSMSIHQRAS